MAYKVARVGDTGTGVCTQHDTPQVVTVTFTTGSPNHFCDGLAVVRVGDYGIASCGHQAQAVTGSSILFLDGLAAHIEGSTGIIIGGGNYTCNTTTADMDTVS